MDAARQNAAAGDARTRFGRAGRARRKVRRGAGPVTRPHPKIVRLALLVLIPVTVVLIGGVIWLNGGRTVGTDDAYVKTDMAQIAPEGPGRLTHTVVRGHHDVEAGIARGEPDPEPV